MPRVLDDFFNNSPYGYVNLSSAGNIQKANVTFLDWLGYTRKELLSFGLFRNIIKESNLESFDRHFRQILNGATTNNLEIALLTKKGSDLDIYLSGKIVSTPGEEMNIRITIVDVTEKNLIQKALESKTKEILFQNEIMLKDLILAARI